MDALEKRNASVTHFTLTQSSGERQGYSQKNEEWFAFICPIQRPRVLKRTRYNSSQSTNEQNILETTVASKRQN
jgi:hypothetical protein